MGQNCVFSNQTAGQTPENTKRKLTAKLLLRSCLSPRLLTLRSLLSFCCWRAPFMAVWTGQVHWIRSRPLTSHPTGCKACWFSWPLLSVCRFICSWPLVTAQFQGHGLTLVTLLSSSSWHFFPLVIQSDINRPHSKTWYLIDYYLPDLELRLWFINKLTHVRFLFYLILIFKRKNLALNTDHDRTSQAPADLVRSQPRVRAVTLNALQQGHFWSHYKTINPCLAPILQRQPWDCIDSR